METEKVLRIMKIFLNLLIDFVSLPRWPISETFNPILKSVTFLFCSMKNMSEREDKKR